MRPRNACASRTRDPGSLYLCGRRPRCTQGSVVVERSTNHLDKTHIAEIYIPKVDFVHVNETPEGVARIMSKYDLEAIPVVDEAHRLVGRITIDDIVDVIREEAEKDYQLAAGLSSDVEADDNILI